MRKQITFLFLANFANKNIINIGSIWRFQVLAVYQRRRIGDSLVLINDRINSEMSFRNMNIWDDVITKISSARLYHSKLPLFEWDIPLVVSTNTEFLILIQRYAWKKWIRNYSVTLIKNAHIHHCLTRPLNLHTRGKPVIQEGGPDHSPRDPRDPTSSKVEAC